jgi:hypothetical protein
MADKSAVTVDLNQFYEEARKDIGSLLEGARVNGAVIFNATKDNVTFHVYNYIDTVYWVDAMKTLVAPGHYGTVAASGSFFKIHPNNKKEEEFLVVPGKAYVYKGPGALEQVK